MSSDTPYSLARLVDMSAERDPQKIAAVVANGQAITYAALSRASDRLRDRLWHLDVRPGDRVALRLHKSVDALIAIFGILKSGAAYVPVDAASPPARAAFILNDGGVKVLITDRTLHAAMTPHLEGLRMSLALLTIDEDNPLPTLLDTLQRTDPALEVRTVTPADQDLAYILYTSGSTGPPKGVALSHRNATSFVDWCSSTFQPRPEDTFASHAPFHFDLSILDIFVSLKHGATVLLIDDLLGKDPERLAPVIATRGVSVWYSTPSILGLLANYGRLDRHDYSRLRLVLFAGEVFPIPQFRRLRAQWHAPRYFNLYGPTETNVCTCYEVPRGDVPGTLDAFPIGRMCPPNRGIVLNERDEPVDRGRIGELAVCGPHVMIGYWNRPDENLRAFFVDEHGQRWFRTGDLVTEDGDGQYTYRGRRDRMVKRRGYRIELGEIEALLAALPDVREVAAVAAPDSISGVRIVAFVTGADGATLDSSGLKKAALQTLSPSMVPDSFVIVEALPRTSTNKIDWKALEAAIENRARG